MKFRYDINGLRAIAVIAVVIFHFMPNTITGGFAGVDVFFVISGFLMTSIIFNGIKNHNFSLFKFYQSRANRIIPALSIATLTLLLLGWFYLIPSDYQQLGQQAKSSLSFTSNILFSKGTSYFEGGEHTKWLLHTWSLSAEWQFYIIYPIIIYIAARLITEKYIKLFVVFLFVASFLYSVHFTQINPNKAYYFLTTRAWEMLLGAIAFLFPIHFRSPRLAQFIQLFGLILIITSYFIFSKLTPWPSYWAALPVFGAYLIILSNYQNNIFFNNIISQSIGKWSYSIYIWHWPIVVAGVYLTIENWWQYGIALSIFLGFLSYHLIEKNKPNIFASWKDFYKIPTLYLFTIVFIGSTVIQRTENINLTQHSEALHNALKELSNVNPYQCDGRPWLCIIGNKNNIKAIITGDSHADSVTTALASLFDLKTEGILSLPRSACPFLLDVTIYRDDAISCLEENKARLKTIQAPIYKNIPIFSVNRFPAFFIGENDPERESYNSPLIYIGGHKKIPEDKILPTFENNLKQTICHVSQNHPVYIFQPIPELGFNVPKRVVKNELFNFLRPLSIPYSEYLARTQPIRDIIQRSADECGAHVLDPAEILCKTGECIATYQQRPIYRDGDHLSEYGNKLLIPLFKKALNQH